MIFDIPAFAFQNSVTSGIVMVTKVDLPSINVSEALSDMFLGGFSDYRIITRDVLSFPIY